VVPVLDQNLEVIGFQYQAIQFNEDGEIEEGEWQDDRHSPKDDRHDDEDEEIDENDDEGDEDLAN